MTTVDLGRIKPLCKCGHGHAAHDAYSNWICTDCVECLIYEPAQDWPSDCQWGRGAIEARCSCPTGIPVAVPLTEKQIIDRAANIAMGLIGNFKIEEIT
jgi:hypothetical protein